MVAHGDRLRGVAEEDEVQGEPHPERVDAAAARDEQPGPRRITVEMRQPEQAGSRGRGHGYAEPAHLPDGQSAESRGHLFPGVWHATYNPIPPRNAPASKGDLNLMDLSGRNMLRWPRCRSSIPWR